MNSRALWIETGPIQRPSMANWSVYNSKEDNSLVQKRKIHSISKLSWLYQSTAQIQALSMGGMVNPWRRSIVEHASPVFEEE